jgi:FMN phosphatase YigB (HAD superfamily)
MLSKRPSVNELAFLLDVDNTLLDNDRVKQDLEQGIENLVGPERGAAFWSIYEEVRRDFDYVDLPHTLERFTFAYPEERGYAALAAHVLLGYPFEFSLYPGSLDAIAHLRTLGQVAILSDGDPVFQPAKIARAGIADAVDGNVIVYAHKEQHLGEVRRRVPAALHVLVDDKLEILGAVKLVLSERIVTVHVRQGKYANAEIDHPADLELQSVGDLCELSAEDFRPAAEQSAS